MSSGTTHKKGNTMSNMIAKGLAAGIAATGLLLTGCSAPATTGGVANCTAAHPDVKTITAGTLAVAAPDFPPFTSMTGGTPSGIDVEIVEAIAKMECLTTSYTQVDYGNTVGTVQSGRTDLGIGDYYRTTSRAEQVGLSDPLYYDGMGLISKDGVSDIPTILTRKVGTVDGYLWVPDLKKIYPSLKIYKSNVEMWADLKAGRIDVGIDSIPVAQYHAKDNAGWQVTTAKADERVGASVKPATAGLLYTKGNTSLETALNEDIATLHSNGELEKIFTKFNVDPSQTKVTDKSLLNS